MLSRICFLALLLISFTCANGMAKALPDEVRQALIAAHNSDNAYVIQTITASLAEEHPAQAVQIRQFSPVEEQPPKTAPKLKKQERKYSGGIEAGATFNTGNAEEQQVNIAADLKYLHGSWSNITEVMVDTTEANDIRTQEEYRFSNQARYSLSPRDYGFLQVDYVSDRFSGFDHRISELLGYGRYLIKEDAMELTAEAGVGARQAEFSDGKREESLMGRVSADFDWQVLDVLALEQDVEASFSSDTDVYHSHTALRSDLTESLYLKLSFDVEYLSEVPGNTENTDTQTRLLVGYGF